jgi:hypothetical protein
MKYILTTALVLTVLAANAQYSQVKVIRTAYAPNVNEASNMQIVLDKLQQESQNTVVYPLVAMTKAALSKAQSIRKQSKERIRSHNNKPKRAVNPNRA